MAALDGVTPAIIGAANAAAAGGYEVERSLRFDDGDGAYLQRTPSSSGNLKKWTLSFWIKRTSFPTDGTQNGYILNSSDTGNSNHSMMRFQGQDVHRLHLYLYEFTPDYGGWDVKTARQYKDPSAWYHIVVAMDTTQATAADRVKIFTNGVRETEFASSSYPAQNQNAGQWNSGFLQRIGKPTYGGGSFDGYLAEINFLDGIAPGTATDDANGSVTGIANAEYLTDFGEFDEDTGVWNPIEYSGTYGNNGFHLDFSDNSSAAALGTDSSGNSNTFTVTNISVSPGAGNDSLIDTPTNYTAASGNNGGSYCTLNPLKNQSQTLKQGNLECSGTSGRSTGTIYASSGKFYWEFTAGSSYTMSGIESSASPQAASYPGENDQQYALYGNNGTGQLYHNNSASSFDGFVSGDVIGVALDMDGGNLYFYKNGSAMNSGNAAVTGLTGAWTANCRSGSGSYDGDTVFNFGQRPFAYTPPTGYVSLCTTNLADPTISDGTTAMDVIIATGTAADRTFTMRGGFGPDLVWAKQRNGTSNNALFDVVRGATKRLVSNATQAEDTQANQLKSFTSTGFTYGSDIPNNSSQTGVYGCWDAGDTTTTVAKDANGTNLPGATC